MGVWSTGCCWRRLAGSMRLCSIAHAHSWFSSCWNQPQPQHTMAKQRVTCCFLEVAVHMGFGRLLFGTLVVVPGQCHPGVNHSAPLWYGCGELLQLFLDLSKLGCKGGVVSKLVGVAGMSSRWRGGGRQCCQVQGCVQRQQAEEHQGLGLHGCLHGSHGPVSVAAVRAPACAKLLGMAR